MARPITLSTGQWADLPLAELAPLARKKPARTAFEDELDKARQGGMAGSGQ